ncbi:MAG: two-component system response regulator, partial [Rhodopirellula bahusiensis]
MPKIICVGAPDSPPDRSSLPDALLQGDGSAEGTQSPDIDWVFCESIVDAFPLLEEEDVAGVWMSRSSLPQTSEIRGMMQSGLMLRDMPEGVAL